MIPGGFPHSEIFGSTPACDSPKLFAANHVLHRLLTPRHSPCALSSLTTNLLWAPGRTPDPDTAGPGFPRRWSTNLLDGSIILEMEQLLPADPIPKHRH